VASARMARIVRAAPIALGIALVVPASAAAAGSLVALGDSYSSGEGAPPFVRPTNTAGNSCHRSSLAWPALVATSTGRPFASFACSGAETAEVVRSDSGRNEAERQVAQRERLRKVTAPELVTVTIGGNDVGFVKVLRACVIRLRACHKTFGARGGDVLDQRISSLEQDLPSVYRRIRSAAPTARLLVVGYPRLFTRRPVLLNCAALIGAISRGEAKYLNAKGAALNGAVRRAASSVGADFIDIEDALTAHELSCSPFRWVHRLTFLRDGVVSPYSFHPTARGYRAIARTVEAELRQLGLD
jgi:lysophospholipase L1-like esterase